MTKTKVSTMVEEVVVVVVVSLPATILVEPPISRALTPRNAIMSAHIVPAIVYRGPRTSRVHTTHCPAKPCGRAHASTSHSKTHFQYIDHQVCVSPFSSFFLFFVLFCFSLLILMWKPYIQFVTMSPWTYLPYLHSRFLK